MIKISSQRRQLLRFYGQLQSARNGSAAGREAGFCTGDGAQRGTLDPFPRLRVKSVCVANDGLFLIFEEDVRNELRTLISTCLIDANKLYIFIHFLQGWFGEKD